MEPARYGPLQLFAREKRTKGTPISLLQSFDEIQNVYTVLVPTRRRINFIKIFIARYRAEVVLVNGLTYLLNIINNFIFRLFTVLEV